jgi:membrane protease subunit (stomatin/prohibitin family)
MDTINGRKCLTKSIKDYMDTHNIKCSDENLYRTTTRRMYNELGWEGLHKSDLTPNQVELLNHVEFLASKYIQQGMSPVSAAINSVRILG